MHAHEASSGATELPAAPAEHIPRPTQTSPAGVSLNSTAQLATLPEELLSNISVKLGSDDLFNLRQTCRDVENKILFDFAREYFTDKCFLFSTSSLKVLAGISQSAKLKNYVKKLYFVTASINDRVSTCPHGAACHYRPSIRQKEALSDYIRDQQALKQDKKDKEFLTKAFKELPNLSLLALVGDPVFLPSGVECYGTRKFMRTTKTSPAYQPTTPLNVTSEYLTCLSHVFRTMMLAVAQSGIGTIKRLETRFGNDNSCGLSPIADLKFRPSTIDVLSKCFANLEDLSICFRTSNLRLDKPDATSDVARASKAMKQFSPVFRTTKNLRLSFDFGYPSGPLCKAFMSTTIDLAQLTKLVVDSTFIDMKSLAAMICKLKSVELLTLHHIELSEGSWVPILKALKSLPALQHLHLQYLQAPEGRVYFLEKDDSAESSIPSLFDYPDDPIMQAAMMGGAGDEGDWASDSSEEMPELLEVDTGIEEDPEEREKEDEEEDVVEDGVEPLKTLNTCPYFYGKDFRDKGMPQSTGRGYYVCLQGADIQEMIPIFIQEYHCVPTGEGDAGDFDVLLGTLAGGFPMPIPIPNAGVGQAPAAPGGGGAGQAAGGQAAGGHAAGGQAGAGAAPNAMDLNNMLASLMNPPAGGAGQTYSFTMPLGSLLGGYHPPPPANNAPANPPAPNTASTHGTAPQPNQAAGPSVFSPTVDDSAAWAFGMGGDDEIPDLD